MNRFDVPALVDADPEANVTDLLEERVAAHPDGVLFALPDGAGWRDVTAAEFLARVRAVAKGLIAAGIEPGERVGLLSSTRYEWTVIDFAAWYAGAMVVPVYETSSPGQIEWCLGDAEVVAAIVESAEHFSRLDEVRSELTSLRTVWQIGLGDLDKLVETGSEVPDEEVDRRRRLATGSDTATVIYTAGTTGRPKGCVLTHSNFVELSRNAAQAMPEVIAEGASTLLFVTTAHVFARFIAVICVYAGVKVGHQADTSRLLESLASFRPTFLLAVPRVFEKVYNAAEQKAEASGRGALFRSAAEAAIECSRLRQDGTPVPLGLRLRFAAYNRLVLGRLRRAMGGRVRHAVSGSAPLGARLGHFYHSLGVEVLEGYGLTETTAPITVNRAGAAKIGTVGPPLPGCSVRLSETGELELAGIGVFPGYWKNEEATRDSFDGEWFRTGDLATIDDDGFVTITGRAKEIIVTAGGKNVAPAVLEDPIRAHPVIGQVVVVGDQRPFVAALLTLDTEMLPSWLRNNGQDPDLAPAQAAQNPVLLAEVQRAVDAANERVSRAESIRKFTILPVEWSEASGHLTPKLSIRRHAILEDFADDVDALYDAAPPTQGQSLRH